MTTQFNVLVADAMSENGLATLRSASNINVDVRTNLTPQQLIEAIPEYDALLVRSSTQVTADVLRAGKKLRVVGRAGVGVDNIDVDTATQCGVIVVNAPTGNTVAAAEHTVALMLSMARQIPQADAHVRAGLWKRNQFMGVEIAGKTLGTVGLGRVALEVVRRAQGLGMKVLGYDPYVTADYAAQRSITLADLETVFAESDFITVHVPLTPQTRNLIDREQLARMKKGVRLLNVARGGIINEEALLEAVESGHVAGAALDVFEPEPLMIDSPLRKNDKIILTPHLGASTIEAQEQVAEDVALQALDVLNDRPARYAVNAPMIPPKDLEFLIPFIDLAERIGSFLVQVGVQGIGDVTITAQGQLADYSLSYICAGVIKGLLRDVVEQRVNLVNAQLLAERRGLNLIERKVHQDDNPYDTMLTVSATSGVESWSISGSVVQGVPHIVGINGLWIDLPAIGNILLTSHQDRPGIIGRVGTMLGQNDINISFMHVGRRGPRTESIMALGIDEVASKSILEQIETWEDINWLRSITL